MILFALHQLNSRQRLLNSFHCVVSYADGACDYKLNCGQTAAEDVWFDGL